MNKTLWYWFHSVSLIICFQTGLHVHKAFSITSQKKTSYNVNPVYCLCRSKPAIRLKALIWKRIYDEYSALMDCHLKNAWLHCSPQPPCCAPRQAGIIFDNNNDNNSRLLYSAHVCQTSEILHVYVNYEFVEVEVLLSGSHHQTDNFISKTIRSNSFLISYLGSCKYSTSSSIGLSPLLYKEMRTEQTISLRDVIRIIIGFREVYLSWL